MTEDLKAEDLVGCWVDGWWGHYTVSRAILRATELGWSDADAERLAQYDLDHCGGSEPDDTERQWAQSLADREGWDLDADLSTILSQILEEVEEWLEGIYGLEGHYWGHHWAGGVGWGLWAVDAEEVV